MRNLLIFLLLLSATAHSQLQSFVVRSGASGDTLFAFNPSTGEYTQLTKQDTSSLSRFTEKVKGLITWGNVQSKPATYTPSTHSHVFADVTGLQAALDAKGTSNFDGAYSSLTGKPTLFDGAYTSLTGKPTLFDGTWGSLTGKPTISGTNTGDQDLSGYSLTSHTHTFASLTSKPTTLSGYGITDGFDGTWTSLTGKPTTTSFLSNSTNKNFVTDAQATVIGNTSGTNTGDNAVNTTYANDYRAANFVAGTNYLAPNGNGSALTGLTAAQVSLGNVTNTSDANKPVSTAQQTALDLKANLSTTPQVVASINATAQAANIATATLYAVPSAGFYRVSIYITVTQAATTSSTMPSTTITYTDGNAGTNSHSTTTTATSTGNSVTTTFAQTTYVLYAKASTNIQYATGSYASSGATVMQYALRIRVEAL